jgi:hypothetical protein
MLWKGIFSGVPSRVPKSCIAEIRGNKNTREFPRGIIFPDYFFWRWRQTINRFARRGAEAHSQAWRQTRLGVPPAAGRRRSILGRIFSAAFQPGDPPLEACLWLGAGPAKIAPF